MKTTSNTHSVTYQNDAEKLIFCSISIVKAIYIAKKIIRPVTRTRKVLINLRYIWPAQSFT